MFKALFSTRRLFTADELKHDLLAHTTYPAKLKFRSDAELVLWT